MSNDTVKMLLIDSLSMNFIIVLHTADTDIEFMNGK